MQLCLSRSTHRHIIAVQRREERKRFHCTRTHRRLHTRIAAVGIIAPIVITTSSTKSCSLCCSAVSLCDIMQCGLLAMRGCARSFLCRLRCVHFLRAFACECFEPVTQCVDPAGIEWRCALAVCDINARAVAHKQLFSVG